MKNILFLVGVSTIISTVIAGESWAECGEYQSRLPNGECYTWNPGVEHNCGTGCTYTYDSDSQTVYIKASGDNAEIDVRRFSSTAYEGNKIPVPRKNFVIDGDIKIGNNVFTGGNSQTIYGANGTLLLTNINHHGFGDHTTLAGTIVIPETATFESLAFHGVTLAEGAKILCAVENCAQKMVAACEAWEAEDSYTARCLTAVENITSDSSKFKQVQSGIIDGCEKFTSKGCTKCKNNNFNLNEGECDRIRWTPAEVAKVLRDDDTNVVTITFKHQ